MQNDQPKKAPRRVLIVDEEAEVQKHAFESLSCAGFDCVPVSDGDQSMECLSDADFDAAVIDLSNPKTNGLRLIAIIRATPKLRNLPILVIVSRRDAQAIKESTQLGANDYLIKPIVWSEMPKNIAKVIRNGWIY